MKFILWALMCLSGIAIGQNPSRKVVIGSKNFSESFILGELVAILLEENYGVQVERRFGLGGTQVAFDALVNGDIDLYPDYTGTGYINLLGESGIKDREEMLDYLSIVFKEKWGIHWSASLGFHNGYGLAVWQKDKNLKEVTKLSQLLGKEGELRVAAPHEFLQRKDGFGAFSKAYGLQFPNANVLGMEAGLAYSAAVSGSAELVVVYTTDGRIAANDMRILEDDKNFFPPYDAAYMATGKVMKEVPELGEIFEKLAGTIDDKEMMALNNLADLQRYAPKTVAHNFLVDHGLLERSRIEEKVDQDFLGFAIKNRAYLGKIVVEHLTISFGALFFALLVSFPLGIWLARNATLAKVVFPVINTFQTIPSLALLGFLIPFMGIGLPPAMLALFLYSLLPIVRNIYSGLNGVDPLYLEVSRGIGLTPLQILMRIELPLALPIIIAGVRTATIIVIGTATLAALIGAGGLGDPIFRGVSTVNSQLIFLGAIPAALLAIVADKLLGWMEVKVVSPGIHVSEV